MKKSVFMLLILAMVTVFVVSSCAPKAVTTPAPAAKLTPKTIPWGTMVPGTAQYIWVTAIANVLNKYGGLDISVQPNSDASINFKMFKSKEILLGMTAHTEAWASYTGAYPDAYPEAQPIRLLASGVNLTFTFISTNPNIKSISDLKGKKLYGKQPSGVSIFLPVRSTLEAYGLKDTDVEILVIPAIPEATRGLIEGKADALFYSVAPYLDELRRSKPFYPIPVEASKAKIVAEKVPGIVPATWPAGLFGTKEATPTVGHAFAFYAHQDLDDTIVYNILKTMYERQDELGQIHPQLKEWSKERALSLVSIPVHPGAIKYYKEQGMWTSEMEAKNKKLLDDEPKLKRN